MGYSKKERADNYGPYKGHAMAEPRKDKTSKEHLFTEGGDEDGSEECCVG